MNNVIINWFNDNKEKVIALAKNIWERPEIAMNEFFACKETANFLKSNGFKIKTYNCKDKNLPANTLIATWGTGKPVIGIIGEYDALDGMGQDAVPYRSPKDGPGHGCGHNLMAPSCSAAAVAVKAAMETEGLNGTIKFYGCPAEETIEGKLCMIRDGVFEGLDCVIAWHPGPRNLQIREGIQSSLTNMKIEFFGNEAHAAVNPDKGRSALDACEIMNVGVNYLREHCTDEVRIHYSYLSAGEKPNIIPKYAALNYFARSKDLKTNLELVERIKKCAAGAALMTETDYKVTIIAMTPGCRPIHSFDKFFYNSMQKLPPLEYSQEDYWFAKELYKNIFSKESKNEESLLYKTIDKPTGLAPSVPGSTDVGYLTYLVPTSRLVGLGIPKDIPGHSWGVVACAGSPIGFKAAIYAGMAQAQCIYDILKNPEVITTWLNELNSYNSDNDVKPIFPEKI